MFKQTDKVNKEPYGKKMLKTRTSSDIEEEIIKQIKALKPFDMEPRKAIRMKPFVLEEENNWRRN